VSVQYLGSLTVADVFPAVADLLDKLNTAIAAYATLEVAFPSLEVTLNGVLDFLLTLEGSLDFAINFEFGLGALKFLAMLDFQMSLDLTASLSLSISNPLANMMASINAIMQALLGLQLSLSLGLPTISMELSLQLDAALAISLAASAKMVGIQICIDALLSLLGPLMAIRLSIEALLATLLDAFNAFAALFNIVVSLTATFALHLPNPGVYLYAGDTPYSGYEPLLGPPPAGLTSSTTVQSIVMLVDPSANPATWASLQFMVKTGP
jgi:hypothetical protein